MTDTNQATSLQTLKSDIPQSHFNQEVDFFSKNGFDLANRIAKAFSTSNAVPVAFRQHTEKKDRFGNTTAFVENPSAIGNCLVAIEVAKTIGMSVIAVMQNADVINGKLRFSSQFQIGALNAARRFTPLQYKLENLGRIKAKYKEKKDWDAQAKRYIFEEKEIEIDNWQCIAYARILDENKRPTNDIVQSIPVTMKMAVEEGWYHKEGSKWQGEMRFQMLQYRAGTFFAGIHAPDIKMGLGKSAEEDNDVIEIFKQADGSFSVDLQELKSSPDIVDKSDSTDADDNKHTENQSSQKSEPQEKKSTNEKQEETRTPEKKKQHNQAATFDPSPEEQEAIRQREIDESAADSSYSLE